jgi:hypothetical protein
MTDPFRSATIRLAHAHPELRDHLLPMLTASYGEDDCPVCGGEGMPLGALGSKKFYRCRDCGMEFSEDGIEPGRGMSASGKTGKLMKRQEKILKDKAGDAMSFDDLPSSVQAALRKVKDQETLWSDVDRWLGDHNNPHLRKRSSGEDEKEGQFEEGEKVPLDKLPKELQKNVENPPDSVKSVTEKMKAKGQSSNKPPGKQASLREATTRLAHARPELRAVLLPLLKAGSSAVNTPWGPPQDVEELAPGVYQHMTAGHGGIEVTPAAARLLSSEARNEALRWGRSLWFEEDVDWAIVAYEKPEWFGKSGIQSAAERTVKQWHKEYAAAKGLLREATTRLARGWPRPTEREPTQSAVEHMLYDSVAEATDGCQVESDGVCRHGHPSWPLALGMI